MRRLSLRVKLVSLAAIAAAVLALVVLLRGGEPSAAEALAEAGIAEPSQERAALYEGPAWQPSPGADGFALALENAFYALYIRPDNTQIALVDKSDGYRWTSNPGATQLQRETVKGQLLSNLQSPFVLTFVKTQGADQTIRESLNALSPKTQSVLTKTDAGLQVVYTFPDKQLGFAIQYELTADGLRTRIPTAGIREEGEAAVFSLDLLPYFGAASPEEDGYLFVPDGPGGLVNFAAKQADLSRGYIHQVYGMEITNMRNWTRSGERREDIAFPVFGIKRGEHAYVAVMTRGADSANVAAIPPGIKSSYYQIFSSQIYREEYLYQMSRLAAPLKAIQKSRLDTDREVEYRFLRKADAGYVGMAKSYRAYLKESGRLGETLKPAEHAPIYVKIMGGNYRNAFNRVQYVGVTTFAQATGIVNDLLDRGVANPTVVYYGWQNQGDYKMDKRFPIEKTLGGEAGARAFVSGMRKKGVDVVFEDDFVWIDGDHSSSSGKNDGVRGIDGTVFVDEGWFMSKPAKTVAMAYDAIRKLKDIGVAGLQFNQIGEMVFHDYAASGISTRADTIAVYEGLLDYAKRTLGSPSVYRGNAYTIGDASFIDDLPHESSYDFMVDETVPFYPIVLHGYVPYTFGEGNLRDDEDAEFLKAVEYGAAPSFFLTHDDSRKLKYTAANFLYSSQYDKWAERIADEYGKFDSLAPLFSQEIANHERLSKDRYATTYADGTRVVVDYGAKTFEVEKGGGA
ncbi:DUF5696 domain-containing protein [Cohnella nanjingensis]|uniref:Uncharacterized protein n=1 Tax=Cohnella nanjingensis TaxID=1387779 RepID=A0A7X0RX58_9BACL|nr:DUF5696 domain-containing protein [Cohnella nanjingensis]MBB6675268.1 hypothetical protein [Cohnella nanjingensis]